MLKRHFALAISGASFAIAALTSLSPASANQTVTSIRPKINIVGCVAQFQKEFTQVPYIVNKTQTAIAAGTTIHWQAYWAGKPSEYKGTLVLSQPLQPGQSISTGFKLSGDSNSCAAYY